MRRFALFSLTVLLSACGGGGGGGAPSAAPAPVLKPLIETYGDSTMAGWDGATMNYISETAPKIMGDLLAIDVVNQGKSSAQVDDYSATWAATMASSLATVVIVGWGNNDAVNHCDSIHFDLQMKSLIAATPKSKQLVLQTPNYVGAAGVGGMTARNEGCVRAFAAVTRGLAAVYGLRLIDAYALTEPLVKADQSLLPDGRHPTAALYKLIGQEMARVLKPGT